MRIGVRDTLIQFTFPALKCRFLNKLSVLSQSRSISSFFLFLSLFLLFFFSMRTRSPLYRMCTICVQTAACATADSPAISRGCYVLSCPKICGRLYSSTSAQHRSARSATRAPPKVARTSPALRRVFFGIGYICTGRRTTNH